MLEPDQRVLLVDALKPPVGMSFDRAVGTTFSLDLEALLLAPVAFALFDARLAESGDPEQTNVLAVMEAVRRHAQNIDLFCQAGQISVPGREKPVLALMEDSVHPAAAPSLHHIFHPKVWCIRYKPVDKTAEDVYRLLVLSRNLTFDRSWDTIVTLDGAPAKPTAELRARNRPLVDFIKALPGFATRPLPNDRTALLSEFTDELSSVEWELPQHFNALEFLPSGIEGYAPDSPPARRGLVVSPFLTSKRVEAIADAMDEAVLVSRPESLDLMHMDVLDRFTQVLVVADSGVDEEEATVSPIPRTEELGERPGANLSGIHAKIWVRDNGWNSEVRTGSTNATTAGAEGNIEFEVALTGSRKRCGVDAVLDGDGGNDGLIKLLVPYQRSERPPLPQTEAEKAAVRLERVGREIARLALLVRVESDGDGYRMLLSSDRPLPRADDVIIRCWPITRKMKTGSVQQPGRAVDLKVTGVSLQRLTSFFAFQLETETAEGKVFTRIVSNARMTGQPSDRTERLLLEQLKSKADVLRYLLFLLADIGGADPGFVAQLIGSSSGEGSAARFGRMPLLETMVKALAHNPDALVPINRLIEDLKRTEEGAELLPDGIDLVWPAIWEARSQLG